MNSLFFDCGLSMIKILVLKSSKNEFYVCNCEKFNQTLEDWNVENVSICHICFLVVKNLIEIGI